MTEHAMTQLRIVHNLNQFTVANFVSVYLRLALGTAFLSAVADRFGLWGTPGARNVSWGDFAHFMSYTAQLNPWAPPAVIAVLAWLATAAETVLGIALVLGFLPRWAGLLSGIVLLLFALGMCVGTGVQSALAYSVFSASAAGFALFASRSHPWSVDGWERKTG
jgi:thiosulfate dehydrogenase (quinone) large subunit